MAFYVPAILVSLAGSAIVLLAVAHGELAIRRYESRQAERARAPERPKAAV